MRKKVSSKNLTLRSSKDKIIESFKKSFEDKSSIVNLKIDDGFIASVGGLLVKHQGNKLYFPLKVNDKYVWTEVV